MNLWTYVIWLIKWKDEKKIIFKRQTFFLKRLWVVLKTHVIPIQIMFQVNRRIITFHCLQIWGLNHSQTGYDHTRSNASKYLIFKSHYNYNQIHNFCKKSSKNKTSYLCRYSVTFIVWCILDVNCIFFFNIFFFFLVYCIV